MKKFLTSTQFLVNGVPAIGVALFLISMVLFDLFLSGQLLDLYSGIGFVFIFMTIVFSSIIIIIRREYPRVGISTIKGPWAVVIGVLFFILATVMVLAGIRMIVLSLQ